MAPTHLIMKHKMWFGALVNCDQTQEFIQIANFANDKPSISMGFSRTVAFWMQDECKGGEKKVKLVKSTQTHTSIHEGGVEGGRWPHHFKCMYILRGQLSRLMADINIHSLKETEAF